MEILAFSVGDLWWRWVWPILQLAIGLGLTILVHEIGHFLAAKWAGITVEEFAVGFGKRLWSRRKGGTEYRINILPLGGYVKMLGQDDFKPLVEEPTEDGSWQRTRVRKRLVVLSAGVAMNVVFAALLFVLVGLVGIRFPAAVVGAVIPGYPAADAEIAWEGAPPATAPATNAAEAAGTQTRGLKPGDRILKVNGRRLTRWDRLQARAILAKPDDVFQVTFEREVDGQKRIGAARIGVKPVAGEPNGTRLAFGIEQATDTAFGDNEELLCNDPFQDSDRVLAIAGREIRHSWEIPPIQRTLDGSPVTVTVQRGSAKVDVQVRPGFSGGKLGDVIHHDGARTYGTIVREEGHKLVLQLEDGGEREFDRREVLAAKDELLDILGMAPRLEVLAVTKGSPAAKAELRPGDVIAGYGDQGHPTFRQFLDVNDKVVDTGTDIVLIRSGQTLSPKSVTPTKHRGRVLLGLMQTSELDSTVVAGVRPGAPAAAAGIQPGDVIEKVNGREVKGWIQVFHALKDLRGQEVALTYQRGTARQTVSVGRLGAEVFDPEDYHFALFATPRPFREVTVRILKRNPLAAIAWGVGETVDFIFMTYGTLRGWLTQRISGKQFSGPVGITGVAIQIGRRSWIKLVYLMAIVGVSVAVINFLPLPVLDGGHVVLVLIEKIRGRPLPLKVQAAIQVVGLAMIVGVFVALTWSDISKLIWHSW